MAFAFTILGANGFIGGHIVSYLSKKGYDCFAPEKGDESIFTRHLGHVVYAIGLTSDFRTKPFETIEAHVCLLKKILEKCRFDSLTYLSSTRVYSKSSLTSEMATLSVNPNNSGDLYNLSKLLGESLCLNCGLKKIKVARLSNVIGIRPDPDIFIDQILEEGLSCGSVELQTSLESKKDYIYIDDAVRLIVDIALSSEVGIFNVASGYGVSNGEIAEMLKTSTDIEVSVSSNAFDWNFAEIDISKTKDRFGFKALKFEEYFPKFVKDYMTKKGIK